MERRGNVDIGKQDKVRIEEDGGREGEREGKRRK